MGSNGKTKRCAFFTFFLKILQNFEFPVFGAPRVMHLILSLKTWSKEIEKSTAQRDARAPPSEWPVMRIFGGLYSARLKRVFEKSLSRMALPGFEDSKRPLTYKERLSKPFLSTA